MKKLFVSFFILTVLLFGSTALAADGYGNIYRLYHPGNQEHLFTPDLNEYNHLQSIGWKGEGVAWIANYASDNMSNPVYRLYSPVTREHLYTTDRTEVNQLSRSGWQVDNGGQPLFDGIGSITIYRLYNPAIQRHLLTANTQEYRALASQGWIQEGVVFSGFDDAE